LRTESTRFGNEFRIHYGASAENREPREVAAASHAPPEIYSLENSLDRSRTFHGYRAERLCCRFRGASRDLSRDAVFASIDGATIPVSFLTDVASGEWQVNVELPRDLAPGSHGICIRTAASDWSQPAEFDFAP
jgi:hypothetical protein